MVFFLNYIDLCEGKKKGSRVCVRVFVGYENISYISVYCIKGNTVWGNEVFFFLYE